MRSGVTPHPGIQGEPPPITERILRRLGRPRWLWIVLWALVPLLSLLVFTGAIRLSGQPLGAADFVNRLTTQAALVWTSIVLLLGGGVLHGQAADLRRYLSDRAALERPTDLFRALGSVRGPVALTGVVAASITVDGWFRYGPLPPLAALPLLFLYLLPILGFVWVYLAILIDLDRLGRRPLALDVFPQDRTLGLEKVGSIAAVGLGLLLIAAGPVMLAGSDEPATLGISLGIVLVSVALFVLSMWRVHRQMSAAKARYVDVIRRLFADAYAPIRSEPGLQTLEAQASALTAAQALEERAHNLLTWPVDEGTTKFIAVVVTGVVTSLVVRGLFAALGF